ncbi:MULTISPECIES: ribonuclease P protein component [Microvirgula]|uniref:Ribonuclease P protein component n=1 Tax=Microvirgula aerodenitrificans TaxID=57480 RepID=A0A2S0P8Y7_9NEIS|nr:MULTISPECIES: ribonuclease P protein component [Microvirgula]AVY93801.1 ribonuclease P protein component [Microvirgula aerodenitrificans]
MAFRFRRAQRLLKTDEFSSVFRLRQMRTNAWFQVYVSPNTLGHARLGLVVGKKTAKRAVRRNYIKRSVREIFRQHPARLTSFDFVVRARTAFGPAERAEVEQALAALFARLSTCRVSSSR